MSFLASTSSQSRMTFEYDVFLTLRDPEDRVRTCVENGLRDGGIRTFMDEMMEKFPIQETIDKSRIIVVVFTPEFIVSDMCLKRLVNIMWCHKTMNKSVLTVFSGVNQEQVLEQLGDLDRRKSAAWELDFDLVSRRAIAEAASLAGFTLGHLEDFNRRSPTVASESDHHSDFVDDLTQEQLEELMNWTVSAAKAIHDDDDSQSDMDSISSAASESDLDLAPADDLR